MTSGAGFTALTRGYIVCGYPRTGGTLLCNALRDTGQLGFAQEYFNAEAITVGRGEHYPQDPQAQLLEIAKRGASSNGVYGVKMFCDQFDALSGFDWISALPKPLFIHLERRDLLGQALSHVRAVQTGQWSSQQRSNGTPHYDQAAISAELLRFATHRARWQLYFARNGIEPLTLAYEDVVADLAATVRLVAERLSVTLPDHLLLTPGFAPQADAISDKWRARFLSETGDLTRLDALIDSPALPKLKPGLLRTSTRLAVRLARPMLRGR